MPGLNADVLTRYANPSNPSDQPIAAFCIAGFAVHLRCAQFIDRRSADAVQYPIRTAQSRVGRQTVSDKIASR